MDTRSVRVSVDAAARMFESFFGICFELLPGPSSRTRQTLEIDFRDWKEIEAWAGTMAGELKTARQELSIPE